MDKKEMKKIKIADVVVNTLHSYRDYSDEWCASVDVDFIIDTPQELKVFDKTYVIDRIKMLTHYDAIVFRLATSDTTFEELEVSKVFISKIYGQLDHLENDNGVLNGWAFKEEVFEILTDKNPCYSLNHRKKANHSEGSLHVEENTFLKTCDLGKVSGTQ